MSYILKHPKRKVAFIRKSKSPFIALLKCCRNGKFHSDNGTILMFVWLYELFFQDTFPPSISFAPRGCLMERGRAWSQLWPTKPRPWEVTERDQCFSVSGGRRQIWNQISSSWPGHTLFHPLAVLPDCSPSAEKSLEVVDCVLTIFLSFHSPLPVSVQ